MSQSNRMDVDSTPLAKRSMSMIGNGTSYSLSQSQSTAGATANGASVPAATGGAAAAASTVSAPVPVPAAAAAARPQPASRHTLKPRSQSNTLTLSPASAASPMSNASPHANASGGANRRLIGDDGDDDDDGPSADSPAAEAESASATAAAPASAASVNEKHTDDIHTLNAREVERGGKYKIISFLASGSYGHVYSATEIATGRKVAIKKLTNIFHNVMHAKRLLREVRILRLLDHTNVIRCLGLFAPAPTAPAAPQAAPATATAAKHKPQVAGAAIASSSSAAAGAAGAAINTSNPHSATIRTFTDLYIVFEFVSTDLQKLIRSNQHFTNLHIQYFLYQILCGLKYVHSAHVLHRDLKPANLLVNADCSLRICDFGLARQVDTDGSEYEHDQPASAFDNKQNSHRASAQRIPNKSAHESTLLIPHGTNRRDSTSPTKLNRQLTKHVVTRWYRAPELILLANTYSSSIDMWSVGCILAELLSMQKESVTLPEDRAALFPGSSCFPLSHENPLAYTDQVDQLNVIFDVIGTPTEDDIAAIASAKARNYLKSLPRKAKISFRGRYPGADPKALDLLHKLLAFDPQKRISAEAAIEHPYLNDVRDVASGVEKTIKPQSLEQIMCFAFEDTPITVQQIREFLWEEVMKDNPQMHDEKAPVAAAAAATTATAASTTAATASTAAAVPAHTAAAAAAVAPSAAGIARAAAAEVKDSKSGGLPPAHPTGAAAASTYEKQAMYHAAAATANGAMSQPRLMHSASAHSPARNGGGNSNSSMGGSSSGGSSSGGSSTRGKRKSVEREMPSASHAAETAEWQRRMRDQAGGAAATAAAAVPATAAAAPAQQPQQPFQFQSTTTTNSAFAPAKRTGHK